MTSSNFNGFPPQTLDYLRDLDQNNNRQWFEEHRADFEKHFLKPAREFVTAMGERLTEFVPGIHADPRVDRSIFRIYRDTRFSRDKTPYKTHLGLWFWEGPGKRMEHSGFYFHLEPEAMILGCGEYVFSTPKLTAFRLAVKDKFQGAALVKAAESVQAKGPYSIGGRHYKKIPRGFTPSQDKHGYLLHNGLFAGFESQPAPELFTPEAVDYVSEHYTNMLPLHRWLMGLFSSMGIK